MGNPELVLDIWVEYKLLVEAMEEDIARYIAKGSKASSVRVRKGMRRLRLLGGELVKASLNKVPLWRAPRTT